MSDIRRIVLLGATGSIGQNTLKVIRQHRDRLQLIGVAAGQREAELHAIVHEFKVPHSSLFRNEGLDGLNRLATLPEADIVLVATTGTIALQATMAAMQAGKHIALASKEVLVLGGHLVMDAARRHQVRVLPVDSEHNAIFQCLAGNRDAADVRRLILTASGGPFRDAPPERLARVTPSDALQHPNWSMGPKITVDSATMANKGLEMIEARWLFDVPAADIDVVVHPQSIVHSMVEFRDGSILAQLSPPSMTFAIQHILLYPDRAPGVAETLDFSTALALDFRPPDETRFPCLRLARQALLSGGFAPAAFNTANEVAVSAFLRGQLPFLGIAELIAYILERAPRNLPNQVEALMEAEESVRRLACEHLPAITRA